MSSTYALSKKCMIFERKIFSYHTNVNKQIHFFIPIGCNLGNENFESTVRLSKFDQNNVVSDVNQSSRYSVTEYKKFEYRMTYLELSNRAQNYWYKPNENAAKHHDSTRTLRRNWK
jgi:hypothetical protein